MDLSIIIVNYQTKDYLESCLKSVILQDTNYSYEIFVINNNPYERLDKIQDISPKVQIVTNKKNFGFAKANNQGIRRANGAYILTLNPDVELAQNYIEQSLAFLQQNLTAGAVTGKILCNNINGKRVIDSAGITITKSRWVFDRGQGETTEQYQDNAEIFGVSAAAAVYRKKALEDIKIMDEYFDEDFFLYKEDIDISWRLRLAGWQIYYIPHARGQHHRSSGISSQHGSLWAILSNRTHTHTKKINYFSYRNHRLMQIKNEQWQNVLLDLPRIIAKEIATFFYMLIVEQCLLKALFQIFHYTPKMLKKRKLIMRNATADWKEIRKWLQ